MSDRKSKARDAAESPEDNDLHAVVTVHSSGSQAAEEENAFLPKVTLDQLPLLSRLPASVAVYLLATGFVSIYLCAAAGIFMSLQYEHTEPDGSSTPNTFLPALYFCLVTLTTVGYGDLVPENEGAQVFVCVYIVVSVVLVGFLLDLLDTLQSTSAEIEKTLQEEDAEDDPDAPDPTVNLLPGCYPVRAVLARVIHRGAFVLFMIIIGMVFFTTYDDLSAFQAFYVSVVSLSTVGYGDLFPQRTGTQVFAILWLGVGTLAFFQTVGAFMDLMMSKRRRILREQLRQRQERLRRHLRKMFDNSGDISNQASVNGASHRGRSKTAGSVGISGMRSGGALGLTSVGAVATAVSVASKRRASAQRIMSMEGATKTVLEDALGETEFVLYRLEKSGRISAEEVATLVQEFRQARNARK
jgi:hypothetical protein